MRQGPLPQRRRGGGVPLRVIALALAAATSAASPARSGEAPPAFLPFEDPGAGDAWRAKPDAGCAIEVTREASGPDGDLGVRADFSSPSGRCTGSLVGPAHPRDAEWRSREWSAVALWYRTTPELQRRTLMLVTRDAAGPAVSFVRALPPAPEWTRLVLTPAMFWHRDGRQPVLAKLERIMLEASAPGTVWLGKATLLPPHRVIPLRPSDPSVRLMELAPGRFLLDAADPRLGPQRVGIRLPGAPPVEAVLPRAGTVELRGPPGREGTGTLTMQAGAATRSDRFEALLPRAPEAVSSLGVIPTPKRLTALPGAFTLPAAAIGTAHGGGRAAVQLVERLRARHGVELRLAEEAGPSRRRWIRIGAVPLPDLPPDARPEAYALRVGPGGVAIVARDERGLFDGVLSLLQLVAFATPAGAPPRAPAVELQDWPELPIRGTVLTLPNERRGKRPEPGYPIDEFTRFVDRVVVQRKLNLVVLEGFTGVRLDSVPELASAGAWSKEELSRFLDFLRRNQVEVVPCVESLGHMDWLLPLHPELAARGAAVDAETGAVTERPDLDTLDTENPAAWALLERVYVELIELLRPRYFHIGADEVHWQTHLLPAGARRAGGDVADRKHQFARWVRRLHAALKRRGIRTAMWTDMLAPLHNGGTPYFVADVLDEIPRDVVMVDWSSEQDPLHAWTLRDAGFRDVWEGNSTGVGRMRRTVVNGALSGLWTRTPWLDERPAGFNPLSWQQAVQAAEFAWRAHPDLGLGRPAMDPGFFLETAAAEAALRFASEPAAAPGSLEPLGPPSGPTLELGGWFAARGAVGPPLPDADVSPWPAAMRPGGVLRVGRTAAALYFLEALDLDAPLESRLREALRDHAWAGGLPVGSIEVRYVDGTREVVPLRYGLDVRNRRPGALPSAYGAALRLFPAPEGGRTALYLRQWVNPKPTIAIEDVTLVAAGEAVSPLLAGAALRATARPPR